MRILLELSDCLIVCWIPSNICISHGQWLCCRSSAKDKTLGSVNKNVDSHHMHANFDLWSRMYEALVKWPSRQIEVTVVKSHADASCRLLTLSTLETPSGPSSKNCINHDIPNFLHIHDKLERLYVEKKNTWRSFLQQCVAVGEVFSTAGHNTKTVVDHSPPSWVLHRISTSVDIWDWTVISTSVRCGEHHTQHYSIPFKKYQMDSGWSQELLHVILELMISFQWPRVCDTGWNAWGETPLLPITYVDPYLNKHPKWALPQWHLLLPSTLREACQWKPTTISRSDILNRYGTCLQKRPVVCATAHLPWEMMFQKHSRHSFCQV